MKRSHFLALVTMAGISTFATAAETKPGGGERCYELRTYHAPEGKLEALDKRFRDHTTGLFVRHGMTNVAYWHPVENPDRLLIYLLSFPSAEAREASWKAFQEDPEWIAAKAASEASGPLTTRKDSLVLKATDFSPEMKVPADGKAHAFEMRTYTATPGKLPNLLSRFRDHTVGLFSKHGMSHFGYFTPADGQPGADNTLIYFLCNDSVEKQKAAFEAFRADPVWVKAKAESETAAGGSLTVPDGVKSVFLTAADYSMVK